MNLRSKRFRDQPQHPLERAVWWIEFVLRQPDPTHLASPVQLMGPFAGNLYDIQIFVVLVLLALGYALRTLVLYIRKTHFRCAVDRKTKTN